MERLSQVITNEHIHHGINYETYRKLIDQLLLAHKTTGENQSESLLNYTRLNVQRMNKWDKIFKPEEELITLIKAIKKPVYWLILTEAWCGDAAQNLPMIAKLAAMNPNIELKLLLRDEHLELMDAYLTNGGRSIPKMLIVDEQLQVMNTWGPRPKPVQEMLTHSKATADFSYDEFAIAAHTWYAKDRGKTLQKELFALLSKN